MGPLSHGRKGPVFAFASGPMAEGFGVTSVVERGGGGGGGGGGEIPGNELMLSCEQVHPVIAGMVRQSGLYPGEVSLLADRSLFLLHSSALRMASKTALGPVHGKCSQT